LLDLFLLVRFGVITRFATDCYGAGKILVDEFSMCTFPATSGFLKTCIFEYFYQISDFLWHF